MTERYAVPAGRHRAEQSIDRSRFICTVERVRTVDEAQAFVKEMHDAFRDATHICWAYVVGRPGSTDRVGMSDDGEPHGTAGRPMLTVLLHSGVGEIAAVVTRYYGGTKLGTGGLVKAYGGMVQLALADLPRTERVELADKLIVISYAHVGAVQLLLPTCEAEALEQEFGVDVRLSVRLPVERVGGLARALADATRGEAILTDNDSEI